MKTTSFVALFLVLSFAVGAVGAAAPTFAQEFAPTIPPTSAKKIILTRLDFLYEGTIRDRGDAISVELESGGSISVSKLDVLFVGDSRAEAFAFQKKRTRLEDVGSVLKLADWASRRQLGPEGIALLDSILARTPTGPERRALERKRDELRETERIRAQVATSLAARQTSLENGEESAAFDALADAANAEKAELERWARPIAFAEIDRFNRKTQPILQKRCATSGCHETENPDAKFVVRRKTVAAARVALLANFRSTLDFVDFDQLDRSPILNHPVVVDANGERVYPFGEDRSSAKDCAEFVDWVSSLTDVKFGAYVASTRRERLATAAASPTLRPGAVSRYDVLPNDASDAPFVNPTTNSNANSFDAASVDAANDDVIRVGTPESARELFADADAPSAPPVDRNSPEAVLERVGERQQTFRDDYDPAIFNARYLSGASATRQD